MQSFELPDFYMPWPARQNPNVKAARAHAKMWAQRVGILGSGEDAVWEEGSFDAMDFAAFAGATHPDAPARELDLLSDWYVWGWFVDDYFLRAFEGQKSDLRQAKGYLARLLSFMPADLAQPIPDPENPAERALADLWPRTAPNMSMQWRQRFVGHIRVLAEANLRGLINMGKSDQRILDLIEYITLRRKVGGVFWSADLVEHSLAAETPAEIYDIRPIRVLNDTFADSVSLRNDIISYQKDIDDGNLNNGVVVAQHFLDSDLQKAVNFVNDLVTSRLHQFEHTMAVELQPMLDEYLVEGPERLRVMRYVNALRDWMAGDLEWELRPGGRYLPAESRKEPALGTAAARVGLSPSMMGLRLRSVMPLPVEPERFNLPEFYMPFSARSSSLLDALRKHAKQWAREMGFLGWLPDPRGKWGNWNEDSWESAEFALFTALTMPDGSLPKLELINDWHVWAWYLKDYFLEVFERRRDLFSAKLFLSRLKQFIPVDGSLTLVPTNPLERSLANLWARSTSAMSTEIQKNLAVYVQDYIDNLMWEMTNLSLNRTADPVDYAEMNLSASFNRISILLAPIAIDLELASEIHLQPQMIALEKALGDAAAMQNDVIAYERRVDYEREINHAILVAQRFLGVDAQETVNALVRLITARLKQFEFIVENEIPALLEELRLDADAHGQVYDYIHALQAWIAGSYAWHYHSNRYINTAPRGLSVGRGADHYKEIELRHGARLEHLFGGPTGPGTSAARIAAMIRSGKLESVTPSTPSPPKEFELPAAPRRDTATGLGTSAAHIAALVVAREPGSVIPP